MSYGHIWWKLKGSPGPYRFGYLLEGDDYSTVRIGSYAGQRGPLYERKNIETKPYKDHLR